MVHPLAGGQAPEAASRVTAELVAFLTARLDEDGRFAKEAAEQQGTYFEINGWAWWDDDFGGYHLFDPHLRGVTDVGMPSRVLADVAAKRRIVERYAETEKRADSRIRNGLSSEPDDEVAERLALEWCCRMLVQAHADHPDFDPSWRV